MNTAGRVEIVELEVRGMTCEDCARDAAAALRMGERATHPGRLAATT